MYGKSNHTNAKKLQDIFNQIIVSNNDIIFSSDYNSAENKAFPTSANYVEEQHTSYNNSATSSQSQNKAYILRKYPIENSTDNTLDMQYTGSHSYELGKIVKKPLTIKNIQAEIQKSRETEQQLNRIIDTLNSRIRKLNTLEEVYEHLETTQDFLEDYARSKILPPWLTRDKFYLEAKKSLKNSFNEMHERYKVSNRKEINKKLESLKPKQNKLRFFKAKLESEINNRSLLIFCLRKLSKKIKDSIIKRHPELTHFVELLTCEQATSLKILKEKYNFNPASKEDFIKEIKQSKITFGVPQLQREMLQHKLKLLIAVSNELQKGISHQSFIEREITRQNLNKEREHGLGSM